MITAVEIAWAAGIIEGEGCVVVHGTRRGQHGIIQQVRLAVEMTDLDILQRLQKILGPYAKLRERKPPSLNPNHRARFILTLNGAALGGWLMTLYVFFGERRRRKVREALHVWRSMKGRGHHYSLEHGGMQ